MQFSFWALHQAGSSSREEQHQAGKLEQVNGRERQTHGLSTKRQLHTCRLTNTPQLLHACFVLKFSRGWREEFQTLFTTGSTCYWISCWTTLWQHWRGRAHCVSSPVQCTLSVRAQRWNDIFFMSSPWFSGMQPDCTRADTKSSSMVLNCEEPRFLWERIRNKTSSNYWATTLKDVTENFC